MRRVLAVALLAQGCRLSFEASDASATDASATDAAPICTAAFSAPVPLAAVNSTANDFGGAFRADGLELIFRRRLRS